jgi:hypothetical protein
MHALSQSAPDLLGKVRSLLLLAQSGPTEFASKLPLIGVKQTRRGHVTIAAFYPEQTSN